MQQVIHIKQACYLDIDLIAMLFNQYRIFYDQPNDLEAATLFLKDRIKNQQSIIFYAAHQKSAVPCGFAQLYHGFSSIGCSKFLILNDLFVPENYRQQGIAKALMQAIHTYAKNNQYTNIKLETAKDNFAAQVLYQKIGYTPEDNHFLSYVLTV